MWLINTDDLSLVFHYECPEMQYAILSHTWEEDEVSFQDFKDLASARLKKGFSKIDWTVYLARQRDLKWAWVDTCCIDKSSSAELSEAINSMYRWYQKSAICYAFLSDLPLNGGQRLEDFQKCRWWTRGWTLQELIAPGEVKFYDQDWGYYGKRTDLQEKITSFTGIPLIAYQGRLNDLSVAQRMSWASRRMTARTEDMAYCLLGLFDVNMPMIYGEGDKAFIRLQEEICKNSSDPTIFAWTIQPSLRTYKESQKHYGLLASHPAEFAGCANIYRNFQTQWSDINYDISIGGSREIIFDRLDPRMDKDYGLLVYVGMVHSTSFGTLGIHIPLHKTIGRHVRSFPDRLVGIPKEGHTIPPGQEIDEKFLKISVTKDYEFSHARLLHLSHSAVSCPKRLTYEDSVKIDQLHEQALLIKGDPRIEISAAYPENFWVPDKKAFLMPDALTCAIFIKFKHGEPDTRLYSLILLIVCERSTDRERYKYLNFKVLDLEGRQKGPQREENELRELVQQIEEEKMTTVAVWPSFCKALYGGDYGRWNEAQKESRTSTWRALKGKHEIQAKVDTEKMASGKAVLSLRVVS